MLFSISLPVRGQAAFVATALESIRAQTEPLELAVLDATPDESVQQRLAPYRSLVAYGYHRDDGGQAVAIQEGWDRTRGEVVAWLNADDYYFPGALASVAEVFRAQPEVDVVYGHGVHVSPDGGFEMYFPGIHPDIQRLVVQCVVCQPACFVRRAAMERVGGLDARLNYTMDWEFWVRLVRAGAVFHFFPEPLAAVRVYRDTKTMAGGKARLQEIARLLAGGGAARRKRASALLGFYSYDLRHRSRTPWEDVVNRVLLAAAAIYRRASQPMAIRGLECWTNRVVGQCEVALPWYGPSAPRAVTVTTDRPGDLELAVNGRAVRPEPVGPASALFLGEPTPGYAHRAALAPTADRVLTISLRSSMPWWRLLSLAVT
jgi:glycosyltransferase involved in cell wall biosynthesis